MPVFKEEEEQKQKIELLRQREEEDLAEILSKKYGVGYIDLSREPLSADGLRLVPEADARAAESIVFQRNGKKLSVAVRTPNSNKVKELLHSLEERGYIPSVFMVSRLSLERAWGRYKDLSLTTETRAGVLDISGEEIQTLISEIHSLEDANKKITEVLGLKKTYQISRILETVIAGSLALGASDIHVEAAEAKSRLRFRLDGVLTDVAELRFETHNMLITRIKLLSGLKLNIKSEAQDGRFSIQIDNDEIEVRTSILPGAAAESVVMRVLNPKSISVPLEELGIEPSLQKLLSAELKRPNGLILNTGPTGSGKTTTLYAFLRHIHRPEIKIITIEDPIEYHLPGIVQTQVDGEEYTFALGLRAALRQDPDVILIGEIRDAEVASTAINASLTGHLVFSTLHTNNAAGAFPRLIDLGINPKLLGSSINVVMAQRLVRRIKKGCEVEVPLTGKQQELVARVLESIPDKALIPENTTHSFDVDPSKDENGMGYKGRIGVYEVIIMTPELDAVVKTGSGEREIREAAEKMGHLTMLQDGVLKALRGVTTLSELERVLELQNR
jgi:type IV pilus assembly protein PilB